MLELEMADKSIGEYVDLINSRHSDIDRRSWQSIQLNRVWKADIGPKSDLQNIAPGRCGQLTAE